MSDSSTTFAAAHADEDRWVVPDEWWERAAPTRGLGPTPRVVPDPAAEGDHAKLVATHRDAIVQILDRTAVNGGVDLAAEATAAMNDPATCTPLGAAVLAVALERVARPGSVHTDAWVLGRGLVFAAEAAALLAELTFEFDYTAGASRWIYQVRRLPITDAGRGPTPDGVTRMRVHLAAATDDEYRTVIARLGELRDEQCGLAARIATSYLAPTETDWAAADLEAFDPGNGEPHSRFLLLAACVRTRTEMETVLCAFQAHDVLYGSAVETLYAALVRQGPDCAHAIGQLLRPRDLSANAVGQLTGALAQFPTDEAFATLASRAEQRFVPPSLVAAAHRFPHRAFRLLGPAAPTSGIARHLLRALAHAYPALVTELPAAAAYLDTSQRRATVEELPEVLRTTPWLNARSKAKQTTLTDLAQPSPDALAWLPGEREEWEQTKIRLPDGYRSDMAFHVARIAESATGAHYYAAEIFALAPDEIVRPHLATVVPGPLWAAEGALRRILARFGADAIPFVMLAVQSNSKSLASLLEPVTGPHVTTLMTRWLEGKRTRTAACAWFDRNRVSALPFMIVAALAKPGKDRRTAEVALRWISDNGHRAEIESAAAALDERAAAAITAILDADPLQQFPAKIPAIPAWLTPELLPALALHDKQTVLPEPSLGDVCVMLAMSGPNGDYAGVEQLRTAVDPESLAEFVWGLFEVWKLADYPSKDGWVLHALGLLGNDDTARRIGPLIRQWPGEGGHVRAVSGLDVLTALGTDVALMQLNSIAEKVKFKGLKSKAQEKVAEVADGLGLTPEQLADRLVPDFGLDANGTFVLDYGPRAFIVGFDEQLKPTVSDAIRDEQGEWQATALRKSLPKPGAKDDPELAPAAFKAFATLKKDVRSAAADQIRRFERAMVRGRRWTAQEHRRLFVEHPLLWHLSRRLVWATFDTEGKVTGSFRIAEDRSYADATDDPGPLDDEATVGLAHPLHLGAALIEWGEVFADYEILQPFPQLQRETYAFTDEERATGRLPRFQDMQVPTGTILGLGRFAWERGEPMDGGVSVEMFRELGHGRLAVVEMEPGIIAGEVMEFDSQKITVQLMQTGDGTQWHSGDPDPTFADLDPITASELLRELAYLEP